MIKNYRGLGILVGIILLVITVATIIVVDYVAMTHQFRGSCEASNLFSTKIINSCKFTDYLKLNLQSDAILGFFIGYWWVAASILFLPTALGVSFDLCHKILRPASKVGRSVLIIFSILSILPFFLHIIRAYQATYEGLESVPHINPMMLF